MKQKDIIAELDALKLRILIEGVEKEERELQKYQKWLDEIMGRTHSIYDWGKIHESRDWAVCKTIANLVKDLYHQKYSGDRKYEEDRRDIMRLIQEVVFMTKYVDKELKV